MGGQGIRLEPVGSTEGIEGSLDMLDLQLLPKGQLMNDVGHVGVLWLCGRTVCGDMEVSGNFINIEFTLEAAAVTVVKGHLHRVVYVAHLVPTHLILDIQTHQITV